MRPVSASCDVFPTVRRCVNLLRLVPHQLPRHQDDLTAVVGLMRALAHELAPHNIRINTIHPTGVATPMIVNSWFQELAARSPELKRTTNLLDVELLDPVDISNGVLYLVSDAGRYVTGITLPVDAGFLAEQLKAGWLKEAHPEVLARHWTDAGEAGPAVTEWQRSEHAQRRLLNRLSLRLGSAGEIQRQFALTNTARPREGWDPVTCSGPATGFPLSRE